MTQKKLKKRKKKSDNDDHSDDVDNDDNEHDDVEMSNQKVLDWPVGKTNINQRGAPAKKHRKGCQKKQNAQL